MHPRDELRALEHVTARLAEQFPDVPGQVVQQTVQEVHRRFDGRVRDYVPILVEREARQKLGDLPAAAAPRPAPTSTHQPLTSTQQVG